MSKTIYYVYGIRDVNQQELISKAFEKLNCDKAAAYKFSRENMIYFAAPNETINCCNIGEALYDLVLKEGTPLFNNRYFFKPFDKVLGKHKNGKWYIDFFDHLSNDREYPYHCMLRNYFECIPYEGNEQLHSIKDE